MSKNLIASIADLVAAFGGTGAFAQWLDVVPSCVSNWKQEGHIPRGYHLTIYLESQKRGLALHPKLFGLRTWPHEEGDPSKRRVSAA